MKSRYRAFEDGAVYFVTSSIVDWIPVFTSDQYYGILIEALSYRKKSNEMNLYAYVFMNSHFHLILSVEILSKFLKEFKSYTARRIIELLKKDEKLDILNQLRLKKISHKKSSDYQVWQEGYHPQQITSEEMFAQKLEYIHQNPLRANLVDNPEDWEYSSASNYINGKGILNIDPLA